MTVKEKLNEATPHAKVKIGDWLHGQISKIAEMAVEEPVAAGAAMAKLEEQVRSCTWRDDGTLVC